MARAQLPAPQRSKTPAQAKYEEAVLDALAQGLAPAAIAKRIAKGDPKRAKYHRKKIWRMVQRDAEFQVAAVQQAKGHALVEGVSSVSAVGRRARRGRVDAAKFLFEVSGIHNPKVQHEHTGDIQITLATMPRPKPVETIDGNATEIVDGEVVD